MLQIRHKIKVKPSLGFQVRSVLAGEGTQAVLALKKPEGFCFFVFPFYEEGEYIRVRYGLTWVLSHTCVCIQDTAVIFVKHILKKDNCTFASPDGTAELASERPFNSV